MLALSVLIMLFALVVDFDDLLGRATPKDVKIKISDDELSQIDKQARQDYEERQEESKKANNKKTASKSDKD
jgi:hypothetical protein